MEILQSTNTSSYLILAGPIIGFSIFVISTATLGNVYFRPNDKNIAHFTLTNLISFIKTPLQFNTYPCKILWGAAPGIDFKTRLKMLQLNWIVMTGLGTLGSLIWLYLKK